MKQETIQKRLTFWQAQLDRLMDAYADLIESGVQEYEIDDRALKRFGIPNIRKAIEDAEEKVDSLEALLNGQKPRKIVAVVPRDW